MGERWLNEVETHICVSRQNDYQNDNRLSFNDEAQVCVSTANARENGIISRLARVQSYTPCISGTSPAGTTSLPAVAA
jgi:hypothetical protein